MKKYFFLQLKRVFRYFPYVLTITLLLFVAVSAALWALMSANDGKSENHRVRIGVTGSLDDNLLQLGLNAFQTFDESKFSIELLQYKEAEANAALAKGEIAAYIVVPEKFIQQALYGKIDPIRFVTTSETDDIVTMFKNEILQLITDMVVAVQKGTYGIGDALSEKGFPDLANEHINGISWEYLDLVLDRTQGVVVEELGIRHALTTTQYYICSIVIFFLLLMGLPFASLYCKKDHSLAALLHSKGISCFSQQCSEFLALFLGFIALISVLLCGLFLFARVYSLPGLGDGSPFLALLLPLLMVTAFTTMIFELSENVIGGLLIHFFLTVSLCYMSGCFYPIYAFPEAVQKVVALLPVCVLREQMAQFFTGSNSLYPTIPVLAYTGLFFGISLASKKYRQVRHGGR